MANNIIEKSIEIKASIKKVWSVFTNPDVSKQIGGYYETDWKVGSALGWKGLDGKLYTNGIILELKPQSLIIHSLLDSNDNRLLSIITYEFSENADATIISTKEEVRYEMSNEQLKESNEGWDFALQLVKKAAEKK